MQHHVALVASDAWRNFSPLLIGGEVLSWKKKIQMVAASWRDSSNNGVND